jgi:hypothetical protein
LWLLLGKNAPEWIADKNMSVAQETVRRRTMAQSAGYKGGEGT